LLIEHVPVRCGHDDVPAVSILKETGTNLRPDVTVVAACRTGRKNRDTTLRPFPVTNSMQTKNEPGVRPAEPVVQATPSMEQPHIV
jgi:hypothetical protein